MKKFKLGSWKVEPNKNLLTSDSGKEVQIEPLNMALLCYFANSPAEAISRDQLIQDVWHNKVVTDHAVYKTINQLRKYLASDGDTQDYIKTIPKKGYALVAEIEQLVEATPKEALSITLETQSAHVLKRWFYKHPVLHTLGLLMVALTTSWFLGLNSWWYANQQSLYTGIKPIKGIDGTLITFNISRDGKWALATVNPNKNLLKSNSIKVVNFDTHQVFELTQDGHDYIFAKWSVTGDKIIAAQRSSREASEYQCNLVIFDLSPEKNTVLSETKVANCSPITAFAEYDDIDEMVYYTYTEDHIVPSKIYSYDLKNEQVELLTSPVDAPFGDWSVELSPDRKKLAFLRVYDNDNELMLFDLETKETELLHRYQSFVTDISWSKDGQEISFQPDKHHVNALSVAHKEVRNLVVNESEIFESEFSRVDDGLYTLLQDSRRIIYKAHQINSPEDFTAEIEFDNGGNNLFPTYANLSKDFVFNSTASGDRQVWLKREGQKPRKISSLDGKNFFYGVSFSPDDKWLLGDLNGKLTLLDMESGQHETILETDGIYYSYPFWWPDGKRVGFSYLENGQYNIYQMDLESQEIRLVTSKGGYAGEVSPDGSSLYFVKFSEPGLWKLDLKSLNEEKIFESADAESADVLEFKGETLYVGHKKNNNFVVYKMDSQEAFTLLIKNPTNIPYISVATEGDDILINNTYVEKSELNYYFPQQN